MVSTSVLGGGEFDQFYLTIFELGQIARYVRVDLKEFFLNPTYPPFIPKGYAPSVKATQAATEFNPFRLDH